MEDVDLLTGGLCEDPVPGALVGELFFTLIKRQFELLRDGDRFFYEGAFSGPAREALANTRLADVIRRNTSIGSELPDDREMARALRACGNRQDLESESESRADHHGAEHARALELLGLRGHTVVLDGTPDRAGLDAAARWVARSGGSPSTWTTARTRRRS